MAGPLPPDKHGLGISEVEPVTTAVWVDVQPGMVPGSQLMLFIQSLALDMLEASNELAVDNEMVVVDDVRVVGWRIWVGSDTSYLLLVDIPGWEALDIPVDSPCSPCPPLIGTTGIVLQRRARRSKTANLIKAIEAGDFL